MLSYATLFGTTGRFLHNSGDRLLRLIRHARLLFSGKTWQLANVQARIHSRGMIPKSTRVVLEYMAQKILDQNLMSPKACKYLDFLF
jgi:hypothetical protein